MSSRASDGDLFVSRRMSEKFVTESSRKSTFLTSQREKVEQLQTIARIRDPPRLNTGIGQLRRKEYVFQQIN
jgi:hypothetical protein